MKTRHGKMYISIDRLWKYSGVLKIISMVGVIVPLGLMLWKGSPFA